eukprot:1848713-Rhodomonas_salina.1
MHQFQVSFRDSVNQDVVPHVGNSQYLVEPATESPLHSDCAVERSAGSEERGWSRDADEFVGAESLFARELYAALDDSQLCHARCPLVSNPALVFEDIGSGSVPCRRSRAACALLDFKTTVKNNTAQ